METNEKTETAVQEQEAPALNTLNLYGDNVIQEVAEVAKEEAEEAKSEEVKTKAEEIKTEAEVKAETIKEAEKIVEKYPEFKDEYTKNLYQSLLDGKDDELFQYLSDKKKDYNTMSDVDVVKQKMKLENPTWSEKYIDVEFKSKYGNLAQPKDLSLIDKEYNLEEYEQAEAFNEALETKEILLNQAAVDARLLLESKKQTIEFPKQQKEEVAKEVPLTQDEIDELNRKWDADVEAGVATLSEFKFKVGDEEVVYKITDNDRAKQIAYLKDYQPQKLALERGWINADGTENPTKLAEDLLKLEHLERIIASASTQMKTGAKKEVIAEIKNLNLTKEQSSAEVPNVSLGELMYGK